MPSTYIIAEAGVNHNGSSKRALALVDMAADAGADAVKFQTFLAELGCSRNAPKASYQVETTGQTESQLDMVKKLELDYSAHKLLKQRCKERNIHFLSTPFDAPSVDLLVRDIEVPLLKIASGEITNAPLLLYVAQTNLPVIFSTGMSLLGDIELGLGVLAYGYLRSQAPPSIAEFQRAYQSMEGQKILQEKVTLLLCTTEYPTPFSDVNLRAMDTLAAAFGLPVGLSDHTLGYTVAVAAAARGAAVVEKHVTLDRDLPGPDHQASLEPAELAAMVKAIREVDLALGSPRKLLAPCEVDNQRIARKSLVARQAIRKGELFSDQNLGIKRPGTGIPGMRYWEFLDTKATRDYDIDELIQP
ncbi:MAG: N-acetylneuraminate synthase [Formivibrio sp.]|nr:N-acetylneuraminate synthase [Formivibrio sp.]